MYIKYDLILHIIILALLKMIFTMSSYSCFCKLLINRSIRIIYPLNWPNLAFDNKTTSFPGKFNVYFLNLNKNLVNFVFTISFYKVNSFSSDCVFLNPQTTFQVLATKIEFPIEKNAHILVGRVSSSMRSAIYKLILLCLCMREIRYHGTSLGTSQAI